MKKIGVLYHPMKETAFPLARRLEKFLAEQGLSVWLCSAWERETARNHIAGTDLVVTIGGDGTILRAAQVVIPWTTPIVGVNLGRLGFMTELSIDEMTEKFPAFLEGKTWVDERSVLEAELTPPGEEHRPPVRNYALNDVVLARGAVVRLIYVEASVDGELLTTYKADGVIVATATGSSGYALAAGGPLLHPQAGEFIVVPILPHLSTSYSMVLPSTAVVKLRPSTITPATLSIDGHMNLALMSGATVTVKRSEHKVRFLRLGKQAFYSTLEQKLKGR